MLRRLVVLSACLLCACTHIQPPEKGGPAWLRLGSAHFVLQTDLPHGQAVAAVEDLEQRRADLLAAAWEGWPDPKTQIEVILFREGGELADFGRSLDGFGARGPLGDAAFVTHAAGRGEEADQARVLQYELSLGILVGQLRRCPVWLATGFSRFLETVRPDTGRGVVVVGEPSRDLLSSAGSPRPGLVFNGVSTTPRAWYAGAWERVYYLFTEHNERFNQYLRRLGDGEQPAAALAATFPDLPESRLADEVRDYSRRLLHTGHVKVSTAPRRRWTGLVTSAPLSAAEVHALFARLYLFGPLSEWSVSTRALAKPELDAALQLDPNEPAAWMLGPLQLLDPTARRKRLEDLGAARPEDFRPWLLLGREPGIDTFARERALRRALLLSPDQPVVLATLADELRSVKADEALALARRASALAPSLPIALAAEAAALAALGRCDEARSVRGRFLDPFTGPDGEVASLPAEVQPALAAIEHYCKH